MLSLPWRTKQAIGGTEDICSQDMTRRSSLPWLGRSSTRSSATEEQPRRGSRQVSVSSISFKKKSKRGRGAAGEQELGEEEKECMLMSRLPYELRESIYLFIVQEENWIVRLREEPEDPRMRKRLAKLRKKGESTEPKSHDFSDVLSLMRTCRLIHAEVEPFLYSQSIIKIPGLTTFEKWHSLMPKARLSDLRNLRLDILFPYLLFHEKEGGPREDPFDPGKMQFYNAKGWGAACSTMHLMMGLKRLELGMSARDHRDMHPTWPDRPSKRLATTILDPLMDMTWVHEFVVEVSWPMDDSDAIEEAPFSMTTRLKAEEGEGAEETNGNLEEEPHDNV